MASAEAQQALPLRDRWKACQAFQQRESCPAGFVKGSEAKFNIYLLFQDGSPIFLGWVAVGVIGRQNCLAGWLWVWLVAKFFWLGGCGSDWSPIFFGWVAMGVIGRQIFLAGASKSSWALKKTRHNLRDLWFAILGHPKVEKYWNSINIRKSDQVLKLV